MGLGFQKGRTLLEFIPGAICSIIIIMKQPKKQTIKKGLNALVWREENLYVAKAIEVEVASQGKSRKEAINNLKEALELYFEDEKLPVNSLPIFNNLFQTFL